MHQQETGGKSAVSETSMRTVFKIRLREMAARMFDECSDGVLSKPEFNHIPNIWIAS